MNVYIVYISYRYGIYIYVCVCKRERFLYLDLHIWLKCWGADVN